jgi:hypothetical protein
VGTFPAVYILSAAAMISTRFHPTHYGFNDMDANASFRELFS